jgi:hypothetical protein
MTLAFCTMPGHLALCLICTLLALPLAGCLNRPAMEERPWSEARWRLAIRENQQRLKTQTQREAEAPFAAVLKAADTVWESVVGMYNSVTGNTPFNAARNLLEPTLAERRRRAIVYLADRDYGREPPYTKYYSEMARTDDQPLVRAAAIRALNRARDKESVTIYIAALGEGNEAVRLEAAKALANVPDPASVPALLRRMRDPDETTDVRVAAADALRNHRTAEVATALVGILRDPKFGVSWQALQSLRLLTGRDYQFDRAAWLNYLSGAEKPFG